MNQNIRWIKIYINQKLMDIYKILLYKFDLKYFFCYNSEKVLEYE